MQHHSHGLHNLTVLPYTVSDAYHIVTSQHRNTHLDMFPCLVSQAMHRRLVLKVFDNLLGSLNALFDLQTGKQHHKMHGLLQNVIQSTFRAGYWGGLRLWDPPLACRKHPSRRATRRGLGSQKTSALTYLWQASSKLPS